MERLTFGLSSDGTKLQALWNPGTSGDAVDESWIKKKLGSSDFSDFYIFGNACADLAQRANAATESFTFDIGEKRDGAFTLSVSPDLMAVYLTLTPPYGGRAVTGDEILHELREKGITSGILNDIIDSACTSCRALNKMIAAGRPSVPGEDTQFISLIPEMKERCPHVDEDEGSLVDYRDLGDIVSVRQGDPLMRRIPPTEGIPGENVKGEALPAIPGKEIPFPANLTGAEVSPSDSDLLMAATAGQPVQVNHGVTVEKVIKFKNVDLSSGNISFEGSVTVEGEVAPGMTIKAAGDIIVSGTIEAAVVEAGGDVEVKGGLIHAEIRAKGTVGALFAEKANISAGKDIVIRELSMQTDLTAGSRIVVGEQGKQKGHIIGGVCRAASLVSATVIGSPAGVSTRVEVGFDPSAREKLAAVDKQLGEKQNHVEEITKSIEYLRGKPSSISDKLIHSREVTLSTIQAEIAELSGQKKRLQKRVGFIPEAKIEVRDTIFYGVHIVIGERALTVDDDLLKVTFRLENDEIVH